MPDLKLGNTDITTVKLGSTQVDKVYLGSNLIWSSWSPSDPDAAAYINVMNSLPGVTLTQTEQQAVDNLFIRMKGNDPAYPNSGNNGIWTAAKALYPYVGSNLAAYRYNALFPTSVTQAVDGAGYPSSPGYQYIAGGITVDGLYGPKGNGTNGVILTNLNWQDGLTGITSGTDMSMGAVYKTTSSTGRDDFGEYDPNPAQSGVWLRTKPDVRSRLGCLEGGAVTGTVVIGGRGHWMIYAVDASDKRVYYQGVQQTWPRGANQTGGGHPWAAGLNTWAFLGLNFSRFQGTSPYASEAQRASLCVNFSSNTLMLSYVFQAIPTGLIASWNQIVEAFCVETGKKTW